MAVCCPCTRARLPRAQQPLQFPQEVYSAAQRKQCESVFVISLTKMPVVIIPLLLSGVKLRLTTKAGLLYLRVLRVMRSVGRPLVALDRRSALRLRYLRSFCALQSLRKDGHRRHGAEVVQVLLHDSLGVERNQCQLGELWCGIPAWYREHGLDTLMKIAIDTIEEQVYEWPIANGYQV